MRPFFYMLQLQSSINEQAIWEMLAHAAKCHTNQRSQNHFLNATFPSRSISRPSDDPLPAASNSLSHASGFLRRTASSAAFTRIPHFSYMVIDSPASKRVHLGTNMAASRGFPACNVRLKNGCRASPLLASGYTPSSQGTPSGQEHTYLPAYWAFSCLRNLLNLTPVPFRDQRSETMR